MVIKHGAGARHGNADALSRIPNLLSPCSAYVANIQPANLPCGCCNKGTRAYKFTDQVDEAIGLEVQEGNTTNKAVNYKETSAGQVQPG